MGMRFWRVVNSEYTSATSLATVTAVLFNMVSSVQGILWVLPTPDGGGLKE